MDFLKRNIVERGGREWYFSSLGMTNKTFQLASSIFSFHIEIFLFKWVSAKGESINKKISM
jgi:hypothetical protein